MTTTRRGMFLLHDPQLNKSTAFTEAERKALGLIGLLPEGIDNEDTRDPASAPSIRTKDNQSREVYLSVAVTRHGRDTLLPAPYVRSRAVSAACLYPDGRRGLLAVWPHHPPHKGLYVSITWKGRVRNILRNWPERDVRFIVVTNGAANPWAWRTSAPTAWVFRSGSCLYTACAGVPPQFTLPVLIDCGTNNESLLRDPLYLGSDKRDQISLSWTSSSRIHKRRRGRVSQLLRSVRGSVGPHALRLLARYRDRLCCFNDDVQGTAAVALAGILSALRITGKKISEQTFLSSAQDQLGLE